jgi:putative Holliday junction resolvase
MSCSGCSSRLASEAAGQNVRVLAIDLGEQRIGVAVSDSAGMLALPYSVIERCGDRAAERAMIADVVSETGAELLVVGMPLSLSGGAGPAAGAAQAEVEELAGMLSVPVESYDERLTTVEATRRLQESAAASRATRPRRGSRRGSTRRRRPVDAEAAAVLLEAFLRQRAKRGGDGGL